LFSKNLNDQKDRAMKSTLPTQEAMGWNILATSLIPVTSLILLHTTEGVMEGGDGSPG
jgi:hypothetical protein